MSSTVIGNTDVAFFSDILGTMNELMTTVVKWAVIGSMDAVRGPLTVALVLFVTFYGIAVIKAPAQNTLTMGELGSRLLKMMFVYVFATSWPYYNEYIFIPVVDIYETLGPRILGVLIQHMPGRWQDAFTNDTFTGANAATWNTHATHVNSSVTVNEAAGQDYHGFTGVGPLMDYTFNRAFNTEGITVVIAQIVAENWRDYNPFGFKWTEGGIPFANKIPLLGLVLKKINFPYLTLISGFAPAVLGTILSLFAYALQMLSALFYHLAALGILITSFFNLILVLAVSPIFICFFLFEATKSWATAWAGQLVAALLAGLGVQLALVISAGFLLGSGPLGAFATILLQMCLGYFILSVPDTLARMVGSLASGGQNSLTALANAPEKMASEAAAKGAKAALA